jgi:hypothetical protein
MHWSLKIKPSYAQLKLPHRRVMSIAGEHLFKFMFAAVIESERILLPSGSLRKRKYLGYVGCPVSGGDS